ncbi:c-type cytochrome [Shewanella litorisediminis]|uniref:Cytochrome c n=1 Tax=Shewanella litorisediminis TaxID=1173586 RepID=A0ABX7G5V5_9GAMM|nr:cytochrome c [Shewanella litorisediminis]MCL2917518.1 cytochrome c [Shewanella litorisediminis]QRH02647.1 cytochrome c [Shewanella litorisediminis]
MKKTLLCLSALLAFSASANNFESADDAIHYRQSAFGLIAYQFGDMSAMLKGKKEFNADVFAQRAENVAALAKLPAEGFIAGSDKGNTEALAKIWENQADFDSRMGEFRENAAKLAIAAKGTDKDAIKAAFMNTGKSCKGCHDNYKKD